jgi:hypothetical protein
MRGSGMSVEFLVDTEALEKFIGAGTALSLSPSDKRYMNSVIASAFNETEIEFNADAAAAAAAGAGIKHMFEWGTLGINTRRTNMRPNPLSERARLWSTHLVGEGLSHTYSYSFKPSIAIVPKPTTTETGMSQEVITKMRDHVFWNKAAVMELGLYVVIYPKDAKFLLIPNYKNNPVPFARPHDVKRGYRLSPGPVMGQPGAKTAGNFTTFWKSWWDGQGQMTVDRKMLEIIESHFMPELAVNTQGPLHPPSSTEMNASIDKEKVRVTEKARMLAKAKEKETEVAKRT